MITDIVKKQKTVTDSNKNKDIITFMNKKSKNSLKTGQTYYSVSNSKLNHKDKFKNNLKNPNEDIRSGKYPNGVAPFVFITLVFIVLSLIGLFATKLLSWSDVFVISSGVSFCLSVAWLILRQRFNLNFRYIFKKMSIQFRINRLKITEPYKNDNYSVNRVKDMGEYNEYLIERAKRTKIFFIVTISLYTTLFIIFIIISVVTQWK